MVCICSSGIVVSGNSFGASPPEIDPREDDSKQDTGKVRQHIKQLKIAARHGLQKFYHDADEKGRAAQQIPASPGQTGLAGKKGQNRITRQMPNFVIGKLRKLRTAIRWQ